MQIHVDVKLMLCADIAQIVAEKLEPIKVVH